MNFEIDMTKVVKIVVKKNDTSFIEYDINDGVIVDASIIEREKTTEEKIEEAKNDPDVKKVNTLIKLSDNARVLTKMAESGKPLVECIKDTVKNEPINIEDPVLNRTPNEGAKAIFSSAVIKSAEIMKEGEKMNEAAKDFRDVIAEKLSDDKTDEESLKVDNDIDKALTISNREKRIEYLKDVISKINNK